MTVPDKMHVESNPYLPNYTRENISRLNRFDTMESINNQDPNVLEMHQHDSSVSHRTKNVPVYILSPVVSILWLYLLKSWRKQLDFNFQRPPEWNDDCAIVRFNDTLYITMHNILDYHAFAMLANGTFLFEALIVQLGSSRLVAIVKVKYELPTHITQATCRADFTNHQYPNFWKERAVLVYKKLVWRSQYQNYLLESRKYEQVFTAYDAYRIVKPDELLFPVVDESNARVVFSPPLQHSDVSHNNPFFFTIMGTDKFHHTQFTSKHDWETHGIYWWMANMNPLCQFKQQLTNVMGQIPHCVPLSIIGKIIWEHWHHLIHKGVWLWNGHSMHNAKGMLSLTISDMEDRHDWYRRRKANKRSRCDGMTWLGYFDGVRYPPRVRNVLQVGVCTPGHYLLVLWRYINFTITEQIQDLFRVPETYGQAVSLTNSTTDIYNGSPIAATIKNVIDLNHQTLLGCVSRAFKLEWAKLHLSGNLKQYETRVIMAAYLQVYFNNINGTTSMLGNLKNKITVFNQMCKSWQSLTEILIALPIVEISSISD